jgi:hypothetical protein
MFLFPLPLSLLVIQFIRAGELLTGADPFLLDNTLTSFTEDPVQSFQKFWMVFMRGIFAWALFAVPATYLMHLALLPIIRRSMASTTIKVHKRKVSTPPPTSPASIKMHRLDDDGAKTTSSSTSRQNSFTQVGD